MSPVKQDTSRNNNPLVLFSIWGIKSIYRRMISPLRNRRRYTVCSFYPSCSEYGILALKKYGFFIGWYRTIKRIKKCTTYKHKDSCVDYP
ncbi:MAG: membrane protein insertion efficiency factor YidD [archaeon]